MGIALVGVGVTCGLSSPPAVATAPTGAEVIELLRASPDPRISGWVLRECGADLVGDTCARHMGASLRVTWGTFTGQGEPSAIAIFSTGGSVGSTGVAVVTPLEPGGARLSIPLSTRVFSARMVAGRLRAVQDIRCVPRGELGSYGYLRLRWFALRGEDVVAVGKRPRCLRGTSPTSTTNGCVHTKATHTAVFDSFRGYL